MEQFSALFQDDDTMFVNAGEKHLPPEVEEGNIEYKLKLINLDPDRVERLVTQMKWRLQEGGGEAVYGIGVSDNGMLTGLYQEDLDKSLSALGNMASKLGAKVTVLRHISTSSKRYAAQALVRLVPEDQPFIDIRVAVIGNADTGKSTLLGVLTHGELDNGQGRARLNLFRHLHEIQSGRTSSISQDIVGYDSEGTLQNYEDSSTTEDICDKSTKIIRFIDVPGHHKYLKTTIAGLTGHSPHYAILAVNASTGLVGTAREHLGFALCLNVPFIVALTKCDLCPRGHVNKVLKQLESVLQSPGCGKIPYRVTKKDSALMSASKFVKGDITPIFTISCVTGQNLELLHTFMNVLSPLASPTELESLAQEEPLFRIEELYTVPEVGPVLGGVLTRGTITVNDNLLLGPFEDGSFSPVSIHSLHRNRRACRVVRAGQAVSVAVGEEFTCIRKGMVLLSKTSSDPPTATKTFAADVKLLFHTNTVTKGFECTVHIGSVCQTARITNISQDSLKTNESATVHFEFLRQPEYLVVGSPLLLRQGTTRGMGSVTSACSPGSVTSTCSPSVTSTCSPSVTSTCSPDKQDNCVSPS